MANKSVTDEGFIQDYIPKVSRTFALAIKFLPAPLKNSFYTSYLLCRVADTLEDTPYLSYSEKSIRLKRLRSLLLGAIDGAEFDLDAVSSIYESVNPSESDDHRLLSDSTRLFEILNTLPESHKNAIYGSVAEMAEGMAEYSRMSGENNGRVLSLKDLSDWDRYCHFVAGTVGSMLTELFILHYNFDQEISAGLKRLGDSFGLGLQKVNVIKDVPDDRERGVCYLPGDILSKHNLRASLLSEKSESSKIIPFVTELVQLTVPHLDDAMEYAVLIPRHLKGVRMFLVVPVFLAIETLTLINSNPVMAMTGPPLKLSRGDVRRLVGAATIRISSDKKLVEYFRCLRDKLVS